MLSHISLCSREIVDKWWFIGSPSLFVKFYRDIDIASTICMGELYSLDEWSFVYSQGETMKGLAQNNDWLSGSSIEVPQITLHRETDIHKPEWENQTKQARHSAEVPERASSAPLQPSSRERDLYILINNASISASRRSSSFVSKLSALLNKIQYSLIEDNKIPTFHNIASIITDITF